MSLFVLRLPERDDGHSATVWKGYRKSSLFPRLPELTKITLMGLVLSPVLYTLFCDWVYMDFRSSGSLADGLSIMLAS